MSSSQQLRRYLPHPLHLVLPSSAFLSHLPIQPKLIHPLLQNQSVKRFYLPHAPWVIYKPLDKTIATEYSRHLLEVKKEKQQQHKREKRRAKKLALQKEKETGQERRGVLEVDGKDLRVGGKSYRKDEDEDANAAARPADENAVMGMQRLGIAESEHKSTQSSETETNKRVEKQPAKQREDFHRKEEARKKEETAKETVWATPWKKNSSVDEIRKPSWFFSGEDALKDD